MTGPTGLAARRVTPDLARGLLLALIAVANVHLYLVARPIGYRGYPTGLEGVDRAVAVVQMVLVDGRVYPLFAALVGYGLARLAERGPEGVLRRRGLVLLGIGALHGLLLFPGDIIGAYAVVILLVAPAVSSSGSGAASSRALLVAGGAIAAFGILLSTGQGFPQGRPTVPSIGARTVGQALAMHPEEWLAATLVSALLTAPAVLTGVVVARTGALDDPAAHRGRLALWAVAGLGASVLLGIGALHGLLLFPGDIIGAYGLVVLLVAPAVSSSGSGAAPSRGLLVAAGAIAAFGILLSTGQGFPQGTPTVPSIGARTVGQALAMHPEEWLAATLVSALLTAPAVLAGVVVARTGALDEPVAHRGRLVLWAVAGLGASVLLGLPLALAVAGVWAPGLALGGLVGATHAAGGYAGALGLLGVMGLLGSVPWPGRDLVAAAGTWSMTLYLAQSVVFTAIFARFAGDLGSVVGLGVASLIGLLVWLAGVLAAGALARAGHRGPAELLVRRLTYPRERSRGL